MTRVFVCLAGRGVYPIAYCDRVGRVGGRQSFSVENHKSVIQLYTRKQNREHTLIMMLTRWP